MRTDTVEEWKMMTAIPDEASLRQAEQWQARLMAPDCTDREREAFERWLAQPAHAQAYAATERLLSGVDRLAAEDARMAVLMQRARRPSGTPRRPRVLAALAAAVLGATVLGLWLGTDLLRPAPAPVEYAAAEAGRTVRLEDGSIVQLDVASRFSARYDRKRRSLVLLDGRAVFQVAHDAGRPLTVKAGDGSVTALGTRFQVWRDGARTVVTLLEGSVAVARQARSGAAGDAQLQSDGQLAQLQPGEQLSWTENASGWTRHVVDADAVSAWSRGRLVFRGAPLADVVKEVNRYATRPLELDGAGLGELPVHGNFVIGEAERTAAALEAALPLRASADEGRITLRRR